MGVYTPDGDRVIVHKFKNANALTGPFMKTATLPVRWQITNTGISGSPSRLKHTCATVKSEGTLVADRSRLSEKHSANTTTTRTASAVEIPIISIRATATINGLSNRKSSVPEAYSLHIQDGPVLVRLRKNVDLTGSNFILNASSAIDVDTSSTATSGGTIMLTNFFARSTSASRSRTQSSRCPRTSTTPSASARRTPARSRASR